MTTDLKHAKGITQSNLIHAVEREMMERKQLAVEYVNHVFLGGDPAKLPGNESWYMHWLGNHAQNINNAYRAAIDKPPIPYHPGSVHAYRLFKFMVDRIGVWLPSQELRKLVGNSQVETVLVNRHLHKNGYTLDKTTRGPVHFRLLEYSEATGAVNA